MNYDGSSLLTLQDGGKVVPETRIQDARVAQDFFRRLWDNDYKRAYKRSRVNGLVDGNPPFKQSDLVKAGRAEAANFNTGNARSYMESGSGSFYDLSTEAPSPITVRTAFGTESDRENWNSIICEGLKQMFADDPLWDYQMQISQWDMVLHGCGPLMFEDMYKVFPRAYLCGDLKVPERTRSDTGYWDACGLDTIYWPVELFDFIREEPTATKVGWDVEYTRRCIANAIDIQQQAGILQDWEYWQQQLKNNSLNFYDDTKVCRVAYVFVKEFDNRITQCLVERDTTFSQANKPASGDGNEADIEFLFHSIGRYANWQEVIHPMYFDHGNGGYHHSVTGLGVKMYSLMAAENRLFCNIYDQAQAPKILFSPDSSEMQQKFSITTLGNFGVLPKGFTPNPVAISGVVNDALELRMVMQQAIQNALSTYKQGSAVPKSGNPVTKFEKQLEASIQASMSKTQFNRYFKQMDMLYKEIYRRASDPNTNDERAKKFQKYCLDNGVPPEALARTECVEATRTIGQGSAFNRKQAVDSLLPIAGALPEQGRENLIVDKISSEAGQSAVRRYYPKQVNLPTEQQERANNQIGGAKTGVMPIVTGTQDPLVFSVSFLKASNDAIASVQKGGNPQEVLAFLHTIGPSLAAHLERVKNDPTRKSAYKALDKQFQQVAAATDKLGKMVQDTQKQLAEQQKKTQAAMTDQQIKTVKAQSDIAIKRAKTAAQLQQSAQKHGMKLMQDRQNMTLEDLKTAADVRRKNLNGGSK